MNAQQAFNNLSPHSWANTSVVERLALIEKIQDNLMSFAKDLGETDAAMKNELIGEKFITYQEGIGTTVNAMGNTLMGIHHLYESLAHGEMPKAISERQIDDNTTELLVYPVHTKDKLLAAKQKGYIHVTGDPVQINPMDKPAGVIAVSGAGNYSSSIEMAMALFLENKAVLHKPHKLNETTDEIWAKIFAPLIERKALAFCDADQGRAMSKLKGLDAIYFTGSTGVARAIQDAASAPLVSECGGNNPCLIVPGRTLTDKEIGTMRAMGVQKAAIRNIFIWEALFVAIVGAVIGLVLALIVMFGLGRIDLNQFEDWTFFLNQGKLFFSNSIPRISINILLLCVMSVLAVLVPARAAANLEPAEALRS